MRKYITIPDVRPFPSYANANARLLYMHVAMGMDLTTRNFSHSLRQLSAELGMPFQQLRTALSQLERDGLVATRQVTCKVTYGLTRKTTHNVTQIHIMSVSELDEATNEATNSPTNTPTNTPPNTSPNTDNNNNNNPNSSTLTHTNAREVVSKGVKIIQDELGVSEDQAKDMAAAFLKRQALKGKTWDGDGDCLAHLISWCEKHRPLQSGGLRPKRNSKADDNQAREAERKRQAEVEASKSEEEKAWEYVQWAHASWKDAVRRHMTEEAKEKEKKYNQMRTEWMRKYRGKEAS